MGRTHVESVRARDPDRHDRLHRYRDDLEHGRGGPRMRPALGCPRPSSAWRSRSSPSTSRCRPSPSRRCRCSPRMASSSRNSGFRRIRAVSRATDSGRGGTDRSRLPQPPVQLYVGLLGATILFLAANAGLIGVSRLVYSMGVHRQMPERVRALHPSSARHGSAFIVFGGIAIVPTCPARPTSGNLYAFARCSASPSPTSRCCACVRSTPDRERPYKSRSMCEFAATNSRFSPSSSGGLGTLYRVHRRRLGATLVESRTRALAGSSSARSPTRSLVD